MLKIIHTSSTLVQNKTWNYRSKNITFRNYVISVYILIKFFLKVPSLLEIKLPPVKLRCLDSTKVFSLENFPPMPLRHIHMN